MKKVNYNELSEYYKEMFECFDMVHFNSSVTEGVYKNNLKIRNSEVVAISHSNIKDHRQERRFNSKKVNLIFIGNTTAYKGFPMLEEILIELYKEGIQNWQLDVWGANGSSEYSLIHYRGSYKPDELEQVFHRDGLLVVPSICNETFSLITLEALSMGIPTLVSSTVGAKDVVKAYDDWFVFTDRLDLKSKLRELLRDQSKLRIFNQSIIDNRWEHALADHCKEIMKLYKR